MENSGLDSGVPTVLPPGTAGEAWLCTITQYANSMRQQLPDVSHPSDEYLTEGAQLLSTDRTPSAVGNSSSHSDTSQESRMDKVERILVEHTKRNTAYELRARQIYVEQREKDRRSRINKFKLKPYQYHCDDLFDIETHILDLTEHARHLVPNLAPLVGQPLLNVTDFELRVDKSRIYTEDQLVPLISMIWKVAQFVDDRGHMQQAAGTTKVGSNTFYDYKL